MKTNVSRMPKTWCAFGATRFLGLFLISGCSQSPIAQPADGYQVVTNFANRGSSPTGLIQGKDGNLYPEEHVVHFRGGFPKEEFLQFGSLYGDGGGHVLGGVELQPISFVPKRADFLLNLLDVVHGKVGNRRSPTLEGTLEPRLSLFNAANREGIATSKRAGENAESQGAGPQWIQGAEIGVVFMDSSNRRIRQGRFGA